MAKKNKENNYCTTEGCNKTYSKWQGKCDKCEKWNTIEEGSLSPTGQVNESEVLSHVGYAGRTELAEITQLSKVVETSESRDPTGFSELDRVMGGGGVVHGSVTLLGGEPGIGKSTILIQTISNMANLSGKKTLYVTGEESQSQIKLRADRLGLDSEKIHILSETNVENILKQVMIFKPKILIIDSIQIMFTSTNAGMPGNKAQLEASTKMLSMFSKVNNISTFIIGHVTKDGAIAGPKVLEHIVDTVLYFEGEQDSKFRLIRSTKNRFGEVNEIAVFVMGDKGLQEVTNPSAIFLTKYENPISGSSLLVTREGSRNLIIEVQALVTESTSDFVQRKAVGVERDRLEMIVAILQKKLGLKLWNQSIFISVVGGVRLSETASDLAVIIALLSSYYDKPLPTDLVVFGETGLAGEVRPVSSGEERMREAIKQGMKTFIVPKANKPRGKKILADIKKNDVKIYTVSDLYELNDVLTQLF